MRDLLPAEARTLSALGRGLLESFELFGYERVIVPVFEYAEVLERGLGALDPREVLRFVEPESGEVVALRPDLTPQIARLVATRLSDAPGPARLCYEGSVVRLRRERARRQRQIPQAGIELVGAAAPGGDLEILHVACAALSRAGLGHFVLDLGHARIAGALIERAPEPSRATLVEALSLKDPAELSRRARAAGLGPDETRAIVGLTELHGGAEVWPRAEKLLSSTAAAAGLAELRAAWEAASAARLAPVVSADLGEVRDLRYYTGTTFQVLADGPGKALASGGRYDRLLEKFGAPRPAAGFAISLDDLAWALGEGFERSACKVLVMGEKTAEMLALLRARGLCCAEAPERAREHASAWRYTHLLELSASGSRLCALSPCAPAPVTALSGGLSEIAAQVSALCAASADSLASGGRSRSA
jgi:ATP phosphoribosyltransferase regulatory subunit